MGLVCMHVEYLVPYFMNVFTHKPCLGSGLSINKSDQSMKFPHRMEAKSLCENCARIPCHLLRYPRISEIPLIASRRLPRKFPYIGHADLRQGRHRMGYLDEMKECVDCALCKYTWQALSALDVYTSEGKTRAGYRIVVAADVGHQDQICRYPKDDSDTMFTLYKLSVLTYIEGSPEHDGVYHLRLDRHFQSADIGVSTINIDDTFRDPRFGVDMTIFGGRKRPLQIDLRWMRKWLKICMEQHGDACQNLLPTRDIFM